MRQEKDLMINSLELKRNLEEKATVQTKEDKRIASLFGKEFFDRNRRNGYEGYQYLYELSE